MPEISRFYGIIIRAIARNGPPELQVSGFSSPESNFDFYKIEDVSLSQLSR